MCVFCGQAAVVMQNESFYVTKGDSSISYGHMMVVSKRHVSSYFDLTYEELEHLNQLVRSTKGYLDSSLNPDGYNIGINVGKWAGQAESHVVAHILPRYAGDVPATELKGGIVHLKKGRD